MKPGPGFLNHLVPRPVDREPRASALSDYRARIVDLLSVLPELSWGWIVLLGPRSVDQATHA